LQNRY